MNDFSPVTATIKPSKETIDRIKNLAIAANAAYSIGSDITHNTDLYYAYEALNRFMDGINMLQLDEEDRNGMRNLVELIKSALDKRKQQV
jgi:predicted DNA-binding protein